MGQSHMALIVTQQGETPNGLPKRLFVERFSKPAIGALAANSYKFRTADLGAWCPEFPITPIVMAAASDP